jgi:6-pyruvoyltetrahydropterin/6-carboxytetrahydropterin synthase
LDHQHINFTVEEFKRPQSRGSVQLVPTTENLALWIGRRLESTLAGLGRGRLSRLRLFEADDLWVDLPWPTQEAAAPRRDSPIEMSSGRPERIQVTEEVFIRSMHHLINRELSAEENEVIFGKCYRLHGHHYRVQVTLEAFYNPHLGLSVSRQRLAKMLSERIVGKYHGRNLNHFFPNTSCEALAYELASDLAPALKAEFPDASLRAIGVQETKKNYFEFRPAGAGL